MQQAECPARPPSSVPGAHVSAPLFRTRVTELFGIRLPVVAGGLQWLATADYVAAAARAGIIGFLSAASLPNAARLRDEIRRCRDLADGAPFGVNISMLPHADGDDRTPEIVETVAAEGVRFVETSGRNPAPYLPLLKQAGARVMHKVPAVRHALKAQSLGVDAVAVVGAECGGHPGPEPVGTMVQAALAARRLSIPLLVGGGIGTGEQLVAALALGADGVIVGTRFLVAEEIQAHPDFKRRLLQASEADTTLILSSLRNTMRVLRNRTAATVAALEQRGAGAEELLPLVAGRLGRAAYESGDTSQGALSLGQAVAFADRQEPLADIVARLEEEAAKALARLEGLALR